MCTCDGRAQLATQKEKEKVYQFLIGLNPEFSTIWSQILSMDPLSNVNRAHSMAAHDEAQRLINQGRDSSSKAMGFATKIANDYGGSNHNFDGSNKGDFKARGRPFCDYCGRNGTEPPAISFMDIRPPINRLNRDRKGFLQGNRGRGGKFEAFSPFIQQQRGNVGFRFGSSNPGQSGNYYSGSPSNVRSAHLTYGLWRPNHSAQELVHHNSTDHMAAQAQAHGD
ncbi:hypothetical protein CRG98_037430 [Punica granatum]|uniref:Uncharacterized protein n=1 Tax=Punica granatum TaxID=22663 RepID=A0A2I0IDY9_PUNGR|nr:hypothetical protein CRG98_037430 [Punica granatum]